MEALQDQLSRRGVMLLTMCQESASNLTASITRARRPRRTESMGQKPMGLRWEFGDADGGWRQVTQPRACMDQPRAGPETLPGPNRAKLAECGAAGDRDGRSALDATGHGQGWMMSLDGELKLWL